MIRWLTISLALLTLTTLPRYSHALELAASLETGIARNLDPYQPGAVWHLEPEMLVALDPVWKAGTLLRFENIFGDTRSLALPEASLYALYHLHESPEGGIAISPRFQMVDVHLWSRDGYRFQPGAYVLGHLLLATGLTLMGEVGGFGGVSRYTTAADGAPIPGLGFSEKLSLKYRRGSWEARLTLLLEQWKARHWMPWMTHTVALAYDFSTTTSVGIFHELAEPWNGSVPGRSAGIRLVDPRWSRLGCFGRILL